MLILIQFISNKGFKNLSNYPRQKFEENAYKNFYLLTDKLAPALILLRGQTGLSMKISSKIWGKNVCVADPPVRRKKTARELRPWKMYHNFFEVKRCPLLPKDTGPNPKVKKSRSESATLKNVSVTLFFCNPLSPDATSAISKSHR